MAKDYIGEEIASLTTLRDAQRGNDAGRYFSLAITALEEARHWLQDAEETLATIDAMRSGDGYKD